MHRTFPRFTPPPGPWCWRTPLLLALLFTATPALAEPQDINVNPCNNVDTTFALKAGQAVPANTDVEVAGAPGNVFWALAPSTGCAGGPTVFTCAGMTVTIPNPDTPVPATTKVTVTGTAGALGQQGAFTLTATDAANPSKTCDGKYLLRVTSEGGGWGDPHLTTVDGVHFDFQSAGEFTALRQDGLEIQTRQTPVPTATVPVANAYTGLASCVSIYTAVAARLGTDRITLQPGSSGVAPSPAVAAPPRAEMQLRVNGNLVQVPENGLALASGGRITRTKDGALDITDRRGTQLVVSSNFWTDQQVWYLNVNVYQTSAIQGVMGRIAQGSWLPALPDGTSLGPKPASAQQRYQDLYEKFADAWRVTNATSLFDYEAGTNTASFTVDEWPRDNAQSCAIQGRTAAQGVPVAQAQQACSAVADAVRKADCIFDVSVTGHTGFADSYVAMEKIRPRGTGWQAPVVPVGPPAPTPTSTWPWWWWLVLLLLAVLAWLWWRKTH
jgi:hypothetical protein